MEINHDNENGRIKFNKIDNYNEFTIDQKVSSSSSSSSSKILLNNHKINNQFKTKQTCFNYNNRNSLNSILNNKTPTNSSLNNTKNDVAMIDFKLESESTVKKALCGFCHCDGNLNELGLTELCSFEVTSFQINNKQITVLQDEINTSSIKEEKLPKHDDDEDCKKIDHFRQFFKKKLNFMMDDSIINLRELLQLGWPHTQTDTSQMYSTSSNGKTCLWSHKTCANWSTLSVDDKTLSRSHTNRCSFCNNFGATITCTIKSCTKIFHYPCAFISGCFLDMHKQQLLCFDHLDCVQDLFKHVSCAICATYSAHKLNEQLICTQCGMNYHASCISLKIDQAHPLIRAGWLCPECKICSICAKLGDDTQVLVCDLCDKGYHMYCLKPPMTSIPSNGYKCTTCRPHADGSLVDYETKSDTQSLLNEFFCQENSKSSMNDDNVSTVDSELTCESVEFKNPLIKSKGKPSTNARKKTPQVSKKTGASRAIKTSSSSSSSTSGKTIQARTTRSTRSKKDDESLKTQSSSIEECASASNDEPTIGTVIRDEDDHHAVSVLVSLTDSFTLEQDMCISCGSFGRGDEGKIVSCSQCGQSYHTYCAGISKLSRVILERGWRCLDCTICEGCGKATDEGRLLLCDDCDISYHLYCLKPPLDHVPEGNWKCNWCIKCVKCGAKQAGVSSDAEWKNNFTECSLCNSQQTCPQCTRNYKDGEIILKCVQCERWSHGSCDGSMTEDDADRLSNDGYLCIYCTKKTSETNNLTVQIVPLENHNTTTITTTNTTTTHQTKQEMSPASSVQSSQQTSPTIVVPPIKRGILDDGVHLTEAGSAFIKKIKIKPPPLRPRTRPVPKIDHDLSAASSNDELNDVISTSKESPNSELNGKKKGVVKKKSIKIGIGGFNLRAGRNRPKIPSMMHSDADLDLDSNSNLLNEDENERKRVSSRKKKKSTLDEVFPPYIREAFFGNEILEKSIQSQYDLEGDSEPFKASGQQDTSHYINIDENIIKQAKHKNNNGFDLDFDELLSGELLNDILKDNQKDTISDEKIMKIFDDKTYEDLLSQIGDTTSDTDLLNAVTPNVSLFQASFTSNNTNDMNKSLNQSPTTQPLNNDLVDLEVQQQQHHQHEEQEKQQQATIQLQLIQTNDLVETKQISDFARQLKESTHQYALINQQQQQQLQTPVRPSFHVKPQQQQQQQQFQFQNQNFPHHQQQQLQQQRILQQPINLNSQNLLIHMQNEYNTNGEGVIHMVQQAQQPATSFMSGQQPLVHQQRLPIIIGPNGAPVRMFLPLAQQQQISPQIIHQQQHTQSQPVALQIDPNFNQNQQQQLQEYHVQHQVTSPHNLVVTSPPQLEQQTGSVVIDEATKQKNLIDKFQMDEDLGELATQAMTLYSNLNFGQLKTQYPSIKDRLKYVQKMWRKLDSQTKVTYVNRAKQNRCKKKSDDKLASKTSISSRKRSKSPGNSDKLSFSDADNLSRAETPCGLDSNMDSNVGTPQNAFMRMKSVDEQMQETQVHQTQIDYHLQQTYAHASPVTQQQLMQKHQQQQHRFNTLGKASPIKPQIPTPQFVQRMPQHQVVYHHESHQPQQPPPSLTAYHTQQSPQQHEWSPRTQQSQQQQQRSTSCHEYLVPTPPPPLPSVPAASQRQLSMQQNSPMPQDHASIYSQPKTPSSNQQQQSIGSPHPSMNQQQQQDIMAKKPSPFSRPPSTPHSDHSFNQQAQMIDSPYHNQQPLTSPRARPIMIQNTYYQQMAKTNSPSAGYPQHPPPSSSLMSIQSPQPQYQTLSPVSQQQQQQQLQQQRLFHPQQLPPQQQQQQQQQQQILIQTNQGLMRMPMQQRPQMMSPAGLMHIDQQYHQFHPQHHNHHQQQQQQQIIQHPRFQAPQPMPPIQYHSSVIHPHQQQQQQQQQAQQVDQSHNLKLELINENESKHSMTHDDTFNHIDEVINDVVAGAGSIPYSSDLSGEDPENSNMSASSSALLANLLEANNSTFDSAPSSSTDLTQHPLAKTPDFPPTDDPVDKKVYSILMQAKQEQQQSSMRHPPIPPYQQQQQQQQYIFQQQQQQQRHPTMINQMMAQQQPQIRHQAPSTHNLNILLNRQPIEPQATEPTPMPTDDTKIKELTDRITQIEKEISSLKRKRTDLNKKNKLLLNVCTRDPTSEATTIIQLQVSDLNEQQQQKYTFNTQEIDRIAKNIANSQMKVEELKNEHKLLIQKIEKFKVEQAGANGTTIATGLNNTTKTDAIDPQKIKDTIHQKIMVGRLTTHQEHNQQHDQFDDESTQLKKKQTTKKRQPKKESIINQSSLFNSNQQQQVDLNFQSQILNLDFQLESQTSPPPTQYQQHTPQSQQFFMQQQIQQQQQQTIRLPATQPLVRNQFINQMLLNRQHQQQQQPLEKSICQDENLRKMLMSSDILVGINDDKPNVEQMLNIHQDSSNNKNNSECLLESMQLDGSIDQFLAEDPPQASHHHNHHHSHHAQNLPACVSTSASSSSSSINSQSRKDNSDNIAYLTYKVVRQTSETNNNNGNGNNADGQVQQQMIKINQPVILNHELLANYGVSIQQQQQQPIKTSILSQHPQQIVRQQFPLINHSNGQIKHKKIKTIRDEVLMNSSMPLRDTGDSLLVQQQQQQQPLSAPPQGHLIPGDNTLLKQLLQTAPKNIQDNLQLQQQQQLQPQKLFQFNLQQSIEVKVEPSNTQQQPSQQVLIQAHTSQPPQTVAQIIQEQKLQQQQQQQQAQIKQEDVKNQAPIIVKKRVRKPKIEEDESFDQNEPKKTRKKPTAKNKTHNENELNSILDQLKSLPQLQLNHPHVDVSNLPISIPARNKNNKMTKLNYSNVKYGHLTEDDINSALNSNDFKEQKENQVPNGDLELSKTHICNHLENKYKICNAIIDTQPKYPSQGTRMVDSIERVRNALTKPLSPSSETVVSTSSMEDDDYSSYDHTQFYLNSVYDPKKQPYIFQRIHEEDQVVNEFDKLETIKEESYDSLNDDQRVSVTLTISKEASTNLLTLFAALDELMLFRRPKRWDLSTLSTIPEQQQSSNTNGTLKPNVSASKLNRETAINVNLLTNLKSCKFCESFLMNDQEIITKKSTEICKNLSSKLRDQVTSSSLASSSSFSVEPVETPLYFCSQHCLVTYEHVTYLQLKAKFQSKTLIDDMDHQPLLNGPNSMLLNSDLFTTDEMEISTATSTNMCLRRQPKRKYTDSLLKPPPEKRWKGIKWKRFETSLLAKAPSKYISPKKEIDELYCRLNTNVSVRERLIVDKRTCVFCQVSGDCDTNGPGRLLLLDVDQWCHLNCALWSTEVYETMNGALINVDVSYKRSINSECISCHRRGASLKCFNSKCASYYHLTCAVKEKCVFYQDKTLHCQYHASKSSAEGSLADLSVHRKVWIQRNEINQIQNCMSPVDLDDVSYTIRIGSLILYDIGQLLPHQLNSSNFHTRDFIYPVGYKATRFYWSYKRSNQRCRYQCMINEFDNKPVFSINILEEGYDAETFTESSPKELWSKILEKIEQLRRSNDMVNLFSNFFGGEFLFGLTEPHIIRLIESLPGVETLTNYAFKYGKLQLLDMPLTINPTGCARSEPKLSTHFRRLKQTLTCTTQRPTCSGSGGGSGGTASGINNNSQKGLSNEENQSQTLTSTTNNQSQTIPYSKQFTLSKSTQCKKLKSEWRQNVYLAKSRIQGLGLYAARDLEKHTMIIEYIGESIRNEVANRREKLYEQQNRGIYMFRIDDDYVIDATISGGLARYVNHCCDPNCIAETVKLEKESKIVIIANKRIAKGEELTYDYKFDYEDESNKIPCMCGAVNCHKWMN